MSKDWTPQISMQDMQEMKPPPFCHLNLIIPFLVRAPLLMKDADAVVENLNSLLCYDISRILT